MRIASIILAVIALIVVYMAVNNNMTPSELGVKNGRLKPLGSKPNGVSTQADDQTKKVDALPLSKNIESSKSFIMQAAEAYGGCVVKEETSDYIHMIFTTGTMKYKDDVEFYFDEKNMKIHYRSESRIGYSDMGLNRERYNAISEAYLKLIGETAEGRVASR